MKIEVIDCKNRILVTPKDEDGIFEVVDTGEYEISLTFDSTTESQTLGEIYFEDVLLTNSFYTTQSNDDNKITLRLYKQQLFIDSRGIVDLKVDGHAFSFDVTSNKLRSTDIQDMIEYLYEHADNSLHSYFSKSKTMGQKDNGVGSSQIFSSAKYTTQIEHILNKYEELLPEFVKTPYTVVRKKEMISDYSGGAKEYDLNWLLYNLDTVDISTIYEEHPDAIALGEQYGWIDKIKSFENVVSFDNYENQVILAGLSKLQYEITTARHIVNLELKKAPRFAGKDKNLSGSGNETINFATITSQLISVTEEHLCSILKRIHRVRLKYESVFADIPSENSLKPQIPKYTTVFKSFKHYNAIFRELIWLYQSRYSLDGDIDIFGMKNMSELYEMYCWFKLKDCFEELFGDKFDRESSRLTIDENQTITLHYQPHISNNEYAPGIGLIRLRNFESKDGAYYEPDYVLEIKNSNTCRYVIIDAKYSSYKTAASERLNECARKYIVDIGVKGEEHKKVDFLFVINPERKFGSIEFDRSLLNNNYYPKLGTMCLKPNDNEDFKCFISDGVEKWFN